MGTKIIAYHDKNWTEEKIDTMSQKLKLKNPFNDDFKKAMINAKAEYIIEDPSNKMYGHSWTNTIYAQHKIIQYNEFKIDSLPLNRRKKILIQSFSSGIDSTTTIFQAYKDGIDLIIPINYIYGQKNIVETINQKKLIKTLQKTFPNNFLGNVLEVNIESMFPQGMEFYKNLRDSKIIKDKTGTEFYTPMRNLLFSTIAAMIGELVALNKEEKYDVYIGIGIHKHSDVYEKDYWDITPEFVDRLNELFALNDVVNLKVYAPFRYCTKTELIGKAIEYNVPYKETWTCYNPNIKENVAIPCLECEACLERELAFKNNGKDDGNAYHTIIK